MPNTVTIEFTVSPLSQNGLSVDEIGRLLARKMAGCLTNADGTKPRLVAGNVYLIDVMTTPASFTLSPPGSFSDQAKDHWRLSVSSEVSSESCLREDLLAIIRLLQRY